MNKQLKEENKKAKFYLARAAINKQNYINELKEENRKLKEEKEAVVSSMNDFVNENQKLKEEKDELQVEYDELEDEHDTLNRAVDNNYITLEEHNEYYSEWKDKAERCEEAEEELENYKKKIGCWLSDKNNEEHQLVDFLLDECDISEYYTSPFNEE